ncbi:MAG: hypothetical protein LBM25_01725 [Bacteroidales bacterium]|jgi:hypothetical protein|nr:hypothetical protein [Bacteroidales bacterium]
MKKILFVLGIFAVLSFTACNTTSDCECTISDNGTLPLTFEVNNFEGNCSDVDWDNVSLYVLDYPMGMTVYWKCNDK